MNSSILSQIARHASIFGPVAAAGGFISDVLQPLAPFSRYVFGVSLAATALLLLIVLLNRKFRPHLIPPLVLSGSFLLFSGVIMSLQTGDAQAKGIIAANVPAMEHIQLSLGLVQKDIAEIKDATIKTSATVSRIEQSSQVTQEATQSIAKDTGKMALTLQAMQESFAGLTRAGGIIEHAQRPEEHYHNARLFEQRGDYINARRSYNAYFAFKLDLIDPHLRYQTFLTVQEGRAGAREVYSAIYEQDKRPLIEFARLLLFEAPQRTEMLKVFIAAHFDFAPAYYELSREFSAARKGTQSLSDKRSELEALDAFKALSADGTFLKYFVDKELAAKWIEDADTRLKALALLKQSLSNTPVTLSASRSNTDWTLALQMREVPRELFYRLEGEDAFRSTGFSEAVNPATGLKMPNMYFSLKGNASNTKISVKYTDVGNEMRGPYELVFDPEKALFDFQKKILDMTKNGWVSFRDYDGKVLVYFTQLLTGRCALKEIAYGINSEATPSTFAVPECNARDPYSVGDGRVYIEAPGDARYLTVQLTYKDGGKSESVRFDR